MGNQGDKISDVITNSAYNEGGSSGFWMMTQGEIVFVTLACFFVVIVFVSAIYAVYQRRRRNKVSVYVDESGSIDTSIPSVEHTMDFSCLIQEENEDAEFSRRPSSSSWHDYRRRSVDSALTFGSRSYKSCGRNQLFSSITSNVPTQYKMATIDRMVAKIDKTKHDVLSA